MDCENMVVFKNFRRGNADSDFIQIAVERTLCLQNGKAAGNNPACHFLSVKHTEKSKSSVKSARGKTIYDFLADEHVKMIREW